MLKSIVIVSEELGISKAAIYKKLKNEKYKNLIIKEHGKIMINEELFELLKSKRKKKSELIKEIEIVKENEVEVIQDNKSNNYKLLEHFMEQIKEKDIQINKLYDFIENNQEIIRGKEQNEEERLKLEEHFNSIDRKLRDIRDSKKNKKVLNSFFRKKKGK